MFAEDKWLHSDSVTNAQAWKIMSCPILIPLLPLLV